jgi:MFS family permease
VAWLGIRPALYLAAVPGLLAAIAIVVAAREARRRIRSTTDRPARHRLDLAALRRAGMARALLPVALFEFGNIATTLLILRATQLLTTPERSSATATSLAILLYAGHNVAATITALLGGRWLDRAGPRAVFAAATGVYALAYALFGIGTPSPTLLAVGFAAAGAGIGLAETAESTMVAHLLPDHLRGTGFGVLGAVQAVGDLVASVTAGVLYTLVSPLVAFGCAAAWMIGSLLATGTLRAPGQLHTPGVRPAG